MRDHIFTVNYISARDCFIYLPEKWRHKLMLMDGCIKIKHDSTQLFISWSPQSNGFDDNTVGLAGPFARALGINDGDTVTCSLFPQGSGIKSIHVKPQTLDDWDIMQINSNLIQSTLLDQIRIVCKGQSIAIWCSNSLSVTVKIVSLEPDVLYGKLETLTEVIIDTPTETELVESYESVKNLPDNSPDKPWSLSSFLKPFTSKEETIKSKLNEAENIYNNNLKVFKNNVGNDFNVFRVHVLESIKIENNVCTNVFVRKWHSSNLKHNSVYKILKVESSKPKDTEDEIEIEYFVKVQFLETVFDKFQSNEKLYLENLIPNCRHRVLGISDELSQVINVNLGSRVILEEVKASFSYVESIHLLEINVKVQDTELLDLFKNYIINNTSNECHLLIYNNMIFNFDKRIIKISLIPEHVKFVEINAETLRFCNIVLRDDIENVNLSNTLALESNIIDFKNVNTNLTCFEKIVSNAVSRINIGLCLTENTIKTVENILIVGGEGSGKTTICRQISSVLAHLPYNCYIKQIDCRCLKGRKLENIQKEITAALLDCANRAPSVLILDDLEEIATKGKDDNIAEVNMFNRISAMLASCFEVCQINHYVSIIATSFSTSKINPILYSARGRHIFNTIYTIPEFEKSDRRNLIEYLVKQNAFVDPSLNWDEYANKTEGFVVQDLVDLIQRAVFESWKSKDKNALSGVTVSHSCVKSALDNTSALRLGSDQFHNDPKEDIWDSIGGLKNVKNTLVEVLQWPAMYPEIFSNSPLRHQSGILLFGPPGCGKTLLAGVVAAHCGLRMISVKGPELLSKYIGASEEGVRNVFVRAQSLKPCILFFDEFDSLAPRRGHDSTGVTDRVVNQLLTQLDGVESLTGVSVLAATSRPDLLDPALLRPGRLDRSIMCPLPDEDDRLSILQSLSRNLTFEDEVDLSIIAKKSEGLSGADLQAVLQGAYIMSRENGDKEMDPNAAVITTEHLIESLKNTRPSLSAQERRKYDRVYEKFLHSRGAKKAGVADVFQTSTRATLA